MRPRLKLFTGDDDAPLAVDTPPTTIRFGELFQIVSEATRFNRTWLRDFEDDEIQVPADLYEVLTTYWTLRPGA